MGAQVIEGDNLHTPEHYSPEDESIFRLDAISSRQLMKLVRALYFAYDRESADEELLEMLEAAVTTLASQDTSRAETLLVSLASSHNRYDREFAIDCAPNLVNRNYSFVRNLLVSLHNSFVADRSDDGTAERAILCVVTMQIEGTIDDHQARDITSRFIHDA